MTRSAVLTALILPLVFCASASAVVNVQREIHAAQAFWRTQGVADTCPHPEVVIAGIADPGLIGYGWPAPVCKIQFDPGALAYPRRTFCIIAVHEVGHTLGLMHSDGVRFPVMVGDQTTYAFRTPFCDGAAKIGRLRGKGDRLIRLRADQSARLVYGARTRRTVGMAHHHRRRR